MNKKNLLMERERKEILESELANSKKKSKERRAVSSVDEGSFLFSPLSFILLISLMVLKDIVSKDDT